MYVLQPYDGPSTRYTCPRCHQPHSFTLYIDESGAKLADTVGRCNHSSACGYHYTPKQYYADHPDLRHARLDRASQKPKPVPAKPKPLCTIPISYVNRSVRTDRDSNLITFLRTFLDTRAIESLIEDYRIGVARNGATIFFQLDIEGRCRTGKVMKYDPETGHRIKDPDVPSRITWVHSLMRQAGQLPPTWNLTQCLFGEHLLKEQPENPVALVESEKTAVICAGLMPKYVWLATGGKSCVNERLLILAHRKVVAFPDVDGYQEWTEKLAKYPELDITVSPLLQQNATPEDMEAHIDIADWLIRTRCKPVAEPAKEPSITFLKTARYIDPAYHAELEALITDFELELIQSPPRHLKKCSAKVCFFEHLWRNIRQTSAELDTHEYVGKNRPNSAKTAHFGRFSMGYVIGILYALYQLIINYLSLSQVIDIEIKKTPPQEVS